MSPAKLVDHIEQIKSKVEVLSKSSKSHCLIVNGHAGWGKTTAVDKALELADLKGSHLSAYSTPLNLFHHLALNPKSIIVLDDVAGLFTDKIGMAILKAAAWPSPRGRFISWGSTSSRLDSSDFEFKGKLVIICNSFPVTADAKAIKSRSLTHDFTVTVDLAKDLLKIAAKDKEWFDDLKTARIVADHLSGKVSTRNLDQISYRTLHMAYDLAKLKPKNWRELLGSMISSTSASAEDVIVDLASSGLKVAAQVQEFERITGLRRRSFFMYRRELGIHRGAN